MKVNFSKRIGLLILLMVFGLFACRSPQNEAAATTPADPLANVRSVVAVGKVVPLNGWEVHSSELGGTVQEILVSEGDTVQSGQPLIRLETDALANELSVSALRQEQLRYSSRARHFEIQKEKQKLEELIQIANTSRELYNKNAETRERLQNDEYNAEQQQALLAQLEQAYKADRIGEEIEAERSRQFQATDQGRALLASRPGVVTEISALIGQNVAAGTSLLTTADIDAIIIEAEVDELFADSLQLNQTVEIYALANARLLGRGKVTDLAATLNNKSILYESANEGEDRRVRRFKIRPDKDLKLTINAKVECRIIL